jgi:hypothetical protein
MNRNNFLLHLALAIVLILIAAFAGQLSRWRKQWKAQVRIIPAAEKKRASTAEEMALAETRAFGPPEVLVKFKEGVSQATIALKTESRMHRAGSRSTTSTMTTRRTLRCCIAHCRKSSTRSRII